MSDRRVSDTELLSARLVPLLGTTLQPGTSGLPHGGQGIQQSTVNPAPTL
ncbi:hypothetical protein [Kutzneria buriramensis]|uniref:Uncharacterized protein n=1 Tax=Kutzneria buriramensis TaxID=1045776 RepID=A0A3E0H3X8_9PSEU|nr:hypothetical protein [Kutzneria buriramensis]REH37977.1 hypothetical protein BCF44_1142 [Kutzneria buriramensis]